MFPSSLFEFGVPEKNACSKGSDSEGGNAANGSHTFGTEKMGESVDSSDGSNHGNDEENRKEEGLKNQREQKLQMLSVSLDCLYFEAFSPPFQACHEETKDTNMQSDESQPIKQPKKLKPREFPIASLGILNNYQCRLRRMIGESVVVPNCDSTTTKVSGRKLSTDAIIRLAGEIFIQSCSQRVDGLSVVSHPFATSFSGLSAEDTRDVDLVGHLLTAAEKVDQRHFGYASKYLEQCFDFCSNGGNPIQRLVYCFSQALQEKINRETGRITSKGVKQSFDLEETVMSPRPPNIAFFRDVPFCQVSQYTGMQAIVENVAGAKKVHVIDFVIMNGSHCVVLMQALAARCEYPLEHLKITAVATKSKQNIEETGKRLMSFAESINLSFSFNLVMVADMVDLNEDLFVLDKEEMIAVHSSYLFSSMITSPGQLDRLMRVIRNINPCIMVVIEVEANLNSSVFVKRFVEALFLYGALFDSLEDCMGHDDPNRVLLESGCFYEGMRNVVAVDGEERTTRHVKINVWREFFSRFGMVELGLSMSSLYQARLVVEKFTCGSSCTLDMDEKCLIVGWKGTPLYSLSGWKFL